MSMKIPDSTKLGDLTLGEFKAVVRTIVEDVVQDAVFELEQELPDPHADKELRPEFANRLRQAAHEEEALISLESLTKELGVDD